MRILLCLSLLAASVLALTQAEMDCLNEMNVMGWFQGNGCTSGCSQCTSWPTSYRECQGQGGQSITKLFFSNRGLTGSIPACITAFSDLTTFLVSNNRLTGTIPSWNAGSELLHFASLEAANNQLAGPLPASIGSTTLLTNVKLAYNQITGSIPSTWGRAFVSLTLNDNQLTGPIPSGLAVSYLCGLKNNTGLLCTPTWPATCGPCTCCASCNCACASSCDYGCSQSCQDLCKTQPCFSYTSTSGTYASTCTQTSATSRTCGPCPAGWSGDGMNCVDYDACAAGDCTCTVASQCIDDPAPATGPPSFFFGKSTRTQTSVHVQYSGS